MAIPHKLRLAEYDAAVGWQHIYVIVPDKTNKKGYITIDPVKNKFDEEHLYGSPKLVTKDIDMKLSVLSGLDLLGDTTADFEAARDAYEKEQKEKGNTKNYSANDTFTLSEETYDANSALGAYFDGEFEKLKQNVVGNQILQLNAKLGFKDKPYLDYQTAKAIFDKGFAGKEYMLYSPKFFSKDWWKKNGLVATVVGGAVLMGGALAISFIGSGEEEKPKPKTVSGIKKRKKNSNKLKFGKLK